eukprot:CAMPEP_0194224030 /NCGR_PEP_ID=MMETSP0156-20130528/36511_1 /TAXON_ID=33649 /ORGANISM="Thalassionema nitzschioides, Strain L26-B" /LENGTH=770 /DNA_ID=CAMNT_0038955415 /DNA_START=84 /DNA_END=2396 /DNA_ORIENTATION=-
MKPRVGKAKFEKNAEKNQARFSFGDTFKNDPLFRQANDLLGGAADLFDPALKEVLQKIIFYKPPVGIVTFYCFIRLLLSGRIFRMRDSDGTPDDVMKESDNVGNSYHRRRKKPGRAWNLAKDDIAYDVKGGVEVVRSKLCQAVLIEERKEYEANSAEDKAFSNILKALKCTYRREMSRFDFIKDIIGNVISAEQYLTTRSNTFLHNRKRKSEDIIEISQAVASMRAHDALLRVARDRLITICSKLKRSVKYWESRVKLGDRGVRVFGKSYVQDQRDRYTLAVGAYRNEVDRLGKIQAILNKRPLDLEEDQMVESIAASRDSPRSTKESRGWPRTWLSKISLNFDLEGEGNIGLNYFDESTHINEEAARETLFKDQQGEWAKAAQIWIFNARYGLRDVLIESVKEDIVDEDVKQHLDNLLEWSEKDMTSKDSLQTIEEWDSVIKLVDTLSDSRRVGEGRMVSFFDQSAKRILKDLNVFGIPYALILIGIARLFHEFLLPRWPLIVSLITRGYNISWTVFSKNVWEPIKDILVSLARRTDESLLEFFDVENEVTSLDNMLKDLGFGDGTIETREEALKAASRQYEHDLDHGMVVSAIGGRLTRLLLLQVQQLKAGLLHALDSIDILVASNRLNMQLAAAIPAVLFFTVGTRLLVRSIFNLRLKSIRSVEDVHAEMSDCLDEMEKSLLLEREENQTFDIELGEFVLLMHGYLVLLDYSAPLLPTRSSEAIHNVMLDLFSIHRVGPEHRKIDADRQVQILRLVKEKHRELLRYL